MPGRRVRDRPAARARPPARGPPPRTRAATSAPRGTPSVAVARAVAARAAAAARASSSASAATRRSRRWSRARLLGASRRSCTRPTPIPGLANRIAVRLGARPAVVAPRHAAARGGGHRQSRSGPRSPPCARAPVTPPLVAVVGGSLGARLAEPGGARPLRPLAGPERRRDPPRERCPRLRRVPHPARRRCARPGDALGYRLVPYEEHMEAIYTDAALVVVPRGRA